MTDDEYAKPCDDCGAYYPGDCICDDTCMCDGCESLRAMEEEEDLE